VGNSVNQGNGAFAGAAYTFTKTATSSSPDCALSATGTARIEGAGTGCVEPGTGTAKCPYMAPGASTVTGTTPDGAISLPFAWADAVAGFDDYATVVLSDVAPRRDGTSPTLSFTMYGGATGSVQTGQPIPASFSLTLCSRTVTVDGVVTLDASGDAGQERGRLAGSIAIQHDGWSVKGTFRTVFCSWSSSH